MSRLLRTRVALSLVMASFTFLSSGMPGYILPAYGQAQPELRKLTPQFVTEPGCPVEVVSADTQLEVDPFGTPMAARHYIDYRNVSSQAVAAVKFRIGYVGEDGKIQLPYLNAPDGHMLQPGQQASAKWRGERVNPRTKEVKIRVLMVKLGDGSVWESAKLRETASQANGEAGGGFQPLQPEVAGSGWGSGGGGAAGGGGGGGESPVVAGTPVPLTDTAKDYKAYPDRTQTGTVPFSSVPGGTPAAGFQGDAFNRGGAPMTAAPAGAGLDGGFGGSAPPAASYPATPTAPAASAPSFAPTAVAPASAAPAAAAPAAAPLAPPVVATPPPAPKASDIADPIGSIDSLLGNTSKPELPNKFSAPAAPAAATPATAPAAAPAAPATAPVEASPSPAPATTGDTTASPTPAPSATPTKGDEFGN